MSPSVGRLFGVLILMTGVIFPMVMLGWLAFRMNRKPKLEPSHAGLILAFNGVLPVGMVLLGFSLMAPDFGAHAWVRLGWIVALAAAAALLVMLGVSRGRRTG